MNLIFVWNLVEAPFRGVLEHFIEIKTIYYSIKLTSFWFSINPARRKLYNEIYWVAKKSNKPNNIFGFKHRVFKKIKKTWLSLS